jgi:hypothetical protein
MHDVVEPDFGEEALQYSTRTALFFGQEPVQVISPKTMACDTHATMAAVTMGYSTMLI